MHIWCAKNVGYALYGGLQGKAEGKKPKNTTEACFLGVDKAKNILYTNAV